MVGIEKGSTEWKSKVDEHPPIVCVVVADEDGIGGPLRMEYFSDEAGRE
jgi:hypothetical protein